jgi:hypothetical protein
MFYNTVFLKHKNISKSFVLIITLLIMCWWGFEYYLVNQYFFLPKNTQYYFNILLSNPLNKYHPVLFFISYIYIYHVFTYLTYFNNSRDYQNVMQHSKKNYQHTLVRLNWYWLLLSFSLYLGSWWALQEGSWGGWWNWDASEVFGLIILTLLIMFFHIRVTYNTFTVVYLVSILSSLLVLFTYLILQMSYTLVSHNFGLSLLGYGYVNITFQSFLLNNILWASTLMYIVYTSITYLYNFYINPHFIYRQRVLNKTTQYIYIWSTLFIFLLAYLYLVSFNPIINNIFWTSLNIEILNICSTYINIKLLILLISLVIVIRTDSLILTTLIFTNASLSTASTIVSIFNLNSFRNVNYLHIIFILIFFISILFFNTNFIHWELHNNSLTNWLNYYYRCHTRSNTFIENTWVFSTLENVNSVSSSNINSFLSFNTNFDTQLFDLHLNDSILSQVIYNHTYKYSFKVSIFDMSSLVTDLVTTFTVLFLWFFLHKNIKIIF